MIVGCFFNGDDDTEVAWRQHDVYAQALRIIIDTCNRLTRFATSLLGDKSHSGWGQVESCDHRTLQPAHDLLAAAWRFRNDLREPQLQLERSPSLLVPRTPENLWIWWLRDEVESWVSQPSLVRNVQQILTNQGQPIGQAAASRLCSALIDRFDDVPWLAQHSGRQVNPPNQGSAEETVAGVASKPATSSSSARSCDCTARGRPACNILPCTTTSARAAREGWGPLE